VELDRERAVVGALVIDLVRLIEKLERRRDQPYQLSAAARAMTTRRITFAEWVPIAIFHELLGAVEQTLVRGDETRALELGAQSVATMRGVHKAYAVAGDPLASVIAMRLAWRAHYNFGRIQCEQRGASTVRYELVDYPDLPMILGLTTVGWGVAAARVTGSADARAEVLERPWRGANRLLYDIHV